MKRKCYQGDQLADERAAENDSAAAPGEDEPPPAKRRKKQRGQNKHRPRAAKISHSEMLCPSLYHGNPPSSPSSSVPPSPACQFGERCRYCHDCATFLSTKPPDLGDHCYIFETFGRCPYGLACRYGNSHMTSDHRNVTNEDLFDPHRAETTINVISRSLQEKLRKKKLELPKSEAFLRTIGSATGKGGRSDVRERGGGGRRQVSGGGGGGAGEDNMQEITEDMQSGNSEGIGEQSSTSVQTFTAQEGTRRTEGDSTACASDGAQEVVGCEGVGEGVRDGEVEGEDGESGGMRVTGDSDTDMKVGMSSGEEGVGVAKTIGATTDEDLIRLQPSEKRKARICANSELN